MTLRDYKINYLEYTVECPVCGKEKKDLEKITCGNEKCIEQRRREGTIRRNKIYGNPLLDPNVRAKIDYEIIGEKNSKRMKEQYKLNKCKSGWRKREPTETEIILSNYLKEMGFVSEHKIIATELKIKGLTTYYLDLAHIEKKICVEIDGLSHRKRTESNKRKDWFLQTKGWTILRFENNEILNDLFGVIEKVKEVYKCA